jgi:hypothetical protein
LLQHETVARDVNAIFSNERTVDATITRHLRGAFRTEDRSVHVRGAGNLNTFVATATDQVKQHVLGNYAARQNNR